MNKNKNLRSPQAQKSIVKIKNLQEFQNMKLVSSRIRGEFLNIIPLTHLFQKYDPKSFLIPFFQ